MENEENKEEPKEENVEESPKSVAPIVDDALKAAAEIKTATEALKTENDRKEALMAREALGGKSSAGETKQKKEETTEELAERFDKGEVDLLA